MKINEVIKSLPASNAAVKNTASSEPKVGWYPAYSASGQDVWLPEYRYDKKGIVVSAVGARCGKAFKADGKWNICANTHPLCVDESKALRDYCWYMINNENWWIKGGTAQPFVKVKDSFNREHNFPSLSKQKKIVKELDYAQYLIQQKELQIKQLDNLVKARFVEMFGDVYKASKYPKQKWNDVVTIKNGRDYKKVAVNDGGYPVYGTGGEMARASDFLCPENTIIVGRKGTINNPLLVREKFWNVDTAFGVVPGNKLHYLYFFWFCKMFDFSRLNKQAVLPSTTKVDLLNIEMQVPPIEVQNQFAVFVAQVDKSKFAITQSLLYLTKIISDSFIPHSRQISVLLSSRDSAG